MLETLVLSILNHDAAIASAAARMVAAAAGPADHRDGLAAHPRAGRGRRGPGRLPGRLRLDVQPGRPARVRHPDRRHRRARLHPAARRRGGRLPGPDRHARRRHHAARRHLRHHRRHRDRGRGGRPGLGAIRIDSGDLGVLARQARAQLDSLGATDTRIVVSGDLDEFAIAALAAAPVDSYGAGTSVVTGSGAPTAGLVYKLVEVDGRPVAKRSEHKATDGGRKRALRTLQAERHRGRRGRRCRPAANREPDAGARDRCRCR